ncbi:cation:proton antiporter [Acholeplasma hippikon]|uniref:NhaP-type Na+/H+ and K+/H+ antiporters n=1 Tax=Acholeplasma hippikon TaxID=264636 RepID=A0A449BJ36_9MOLU|nr:cation:proton antiporter [Acholeplasma hippikon]VEU82413.1 NhaP-type Na+/H+ and K+/H+ antiporters [Acholeplasma hippikon]
MNLYEKLGVTSNVAIVILSVGIMLSLGFLMTRLTKKLKLPNVTAYIVVGILIGPFVLNLIPREVVSGMDFLADIALAFIAFSTGEFFKLSILKKNGLKVVVITIFEALFASILIFFVTFYLLKMTLAFSIVLAALAAATAPASTVMTIRQTGAKGDFVDTLIQVVALDDIVGLVAYSIAISVAIALNSGGSISFGSILQPIAINIGVVLIGGLFGYFMKLLMTAKRSTDNRLIIALALIFLFCGICALLDISPLLGCMSMGTVYINITDDDKLFKQLNYFSPPILLLFFVRSGVNFKLDALLSTSTLVGTTPLLLIGIIYFIVRIIGKYFGAYSGSAVVGKSKEVKNYLGLALIPQAGVAIGLAALGARALGGESGQALETIILASSVLYELIGPVCAKLALYLSKSYSNKLEDITEVVEVKADGTKKSDVEILIERINEIKEKIPKHEKALMQEEIAFTEEAEQYYQMQSRVGLLNRKK